MKIAWCFLRRMGSTMPVVAALVVMGLAYALPAASPRSAATAKGAPAAKPAAPAKPGPALDDPGFFAALDLSRPELAQVQAAVEKQDWSDAKHRFVEHLKARTSPKWYFNWRDKPAADKRPPKFDRTAADRYARNELVSCGVWHDFKQSIDWNSNPMPSQYAEWTWQLSRHPFWETLGQAYWATGDETYAKAFVFQMTDWIRSQPVPASSGNRAYSTWRTIETGIRTFGSWPNSFCYFLSSPSFDDESVVLMVKSFYDHAQHLMKYPTTGNWLAMEANGLFHTGVLFPEFKEAAAWRKTAIDRLYIELDAQVYADGAQIELAAGYHNVSLNSFEMPVQIAKLNDLPLPADYITKLERMFHYDLYVSMPNGRMPGLNDSGDTAIASWMKKATAYYPKREDFRWATSGGKKGSAPVTRSCAFPWAGHLVMRSGWDADARYFLLDAGPFGYAHQHEDKLTFVLAAYGRVHVIDPGNYPYDSSAWRRYHIDTFAHNTVLVDSQPQRRRGAKDRREYVVKDPLPQGFVTTDGWDYAAGTYDEGYGQRDQRLAVHRREVAFVKAGARSGAPADYWVILDTYTPRDAGDKAHTYDAMFHLNADDITLDADHLAVLTKNAKGSNLQIRAAAIGGAAGARAAGEAATTKMTVTDQRGQEKPYVQGWVYNGGYTVRPIPTPVFRVEAQGPARAAFVLVPLKEGQREIVERLGLAASSNNAMADVTVGFGGGTSQTIRFSGQAKDPIRIGP